MTRRLIIIRHGQSVWNQQKLFTGWTDVDITDQGRAEAISAGKKLAAKGWRIDAGYTSYQKRAIKTLNLALEHCDQLYLPVTKDWRINERHYGALQGESKVEMAEKVGAEQVHIWRRSFDTPPPALDPNDPRHPRHDPRYAHLTPAQLPASESLKDTLIRVQPVIDEVFLPALRAEKLLLVSAHGNSIRAMVKYFDQLSDADITSVNIPTGVPLVYEFADDLTVTAKYYLEDEA